jgi:hypothetical protein
VERSEYDSHQSLTEKMAVLALRCGAPVSRIRNK